TTTELLAALRERNLGLTDFQAVELWCGACDLVKFAKHVPTLEEAQATLEGAYRMVDALRERAAAVALPPEGEGAVRVAAAWVGRRLACRPARSPERTALLGGMVGAGHPVSARGRGGAREPARGLAAAPRRRGIPLRAAVGGAARPGRRRPGRLGAA